MISRLCGAMRLAALRMIYYFKEQEYCMKTTTACMKKRRKYQYVGLLYIGPWIIGLLVFQLYMMKSKKNTIFVLLMVATLTSSNGIPVMAADGATVPPANRSSSGTLSTESAPTLGTVPVSGGSFFELKNVTMLNEQKGRTVTFTVSVHNESSMDLLFIDYWVYMRTKSGNQMSVRILPQDKDNNKIPAKSVQDINLNYESP